MTIECSIAQSEELSAFLPAFLAAQSEMGKIEKNKVNDFHGNAYADLGTVLNVCRPVLNEKGIVIMFFPCYGVGAIGVQTKLIHAESGQWMANTVQGPLPKQDPQGIGIALTYFRRYGLTALIGLAQEDKDGNIGDMPLQNRNAQPAQQKKNYQQNNQNPQKINALIQEIHTKLQNMPSDMDFIHFVTQELPKKQLRNHEERQKVFDFCKEAGKKLGITFLPETKIWVKQQDLEGMGEGALPPT